MKRAVLWDSSALLALINRRDSNHLRAVEHAHRIATRPGFITNYIEAEAHALLLKKVGRVLARTWLTEGGLPVLRVRPAEEERAKEILITHDDKDWSLCDAISFATMEMRGVRTAFSFDADFRQYGRFDVLGA